MIRILKIFVPGVLALLCATGAAAQGRNLGMISLASVHGRFLQADTDGELAAAKEQRGEEETWFLVELDRDARLYALQNWRTGKYLGKIDGGCVDATSATVGKAEAWQLVVGADYGVLDALALRSALDGTVLGASSPGTDTGCGAEVAAGGGGIPPQGAATWPGWWTVRSAAAPAAGAKPWNAKGRPADLTALFSSLL